MLILILYFLVSFFTITSKNFMTVEEKLKKFHIKLNVILVERRSYVAHIRVHGSWFVELQLSKLLFNFSFI